MQLTIDMTDDRLESLLCSAFEGGVGYWCRIMEYVDPPDLAADDKKREHPHMYYPLHGGAVVCRVTGEEDTDEKYKPLRLDGDAVKRGLALMAEKSPRSFAAILSDDADACTGDVFLQYCLLGEVVYG